MCLGNLGLCVKQAASKICMLRQVHAEQTTPSLQAGSNLLAHHVKGSAVRMPYASTTANPNAVRTMENSQMGYQTKHQSGKVQHDSAAEYGPVHARQPVDHLEKRACVQPLGSSWKVTSIMTCRDGRSTIGALRTTCSTTDQRWRVMRWLGKCMLEPLCSPCIG